jgi:hypothetical protein
MKLKRLVSGILGLGLSFPVFADPGEELPVGPTAGSEETLPVGDEDAMDEAPVDVLAALEKIVGNMKDAERLLAELNAGRLQEQEAAVRGLEELIKSCADRDGSSSSDKRDSAADKSGRTPKDMNKDDSGAAARSGYDSHGSHVDRAVVERTADGTRWGNLPLRLREELSQSSDDLRSLRGSYSEKHHEYSKMLSQE